MHTTTTHQRTTKKVKEASWLTVLRIVLACVFLFSGMSKAIDPVGWGIKMDEYFTSMNMGFMHPFALWIGILVNIAEFTMGFMLLFKIRVRLTTLGYLLFMLFFFFLTAWLAIAEHLEVHYGYHFGVVKDCGCFGQAITMSNLETFMKNVLLLFLTLIVFGKRKTIPDIRLTLFGQWLFACVGAGIVFLVQYYCLYNLPLVDFSDWKKGKNVTELFIEKPAEKEILFLYADKNGVEKRLSIEEMDNITDKYPKFYEEYNYIDRIDSVITEAVHPKISGFSMLDRQGKDWANIYLNENKEMVYLLFMPDLDEVDERGIKSENLQKLIANCIAKNIDFAGITNSSLENIEAFIAKYNITFPIYYHSVDPVKGPFMVRDAIRSNPGLILLKNGVVAEKKGWRQF